MTPWTRGHVVVRLSAGRTDVAGPCPLTVWPGVPFVRGDAQSAVDLTLH